MHSKKHKIYYKLILCTAILFNSIILFPGKINAQVYNELPEIFPTFNIEVSNHPSHGYYFISGRFQTATPTTFAIILDTSCTTVFFQRQNYLSSAEDFTLQENGLLSYCYQTLGGSDFPFTVLDSNYNVVARLGTANGYTNDLHEFLLLEDNSYWILAQDHREVDMSKIVPGGDPNAIVIGAVVQHIDEAGEVLFEWNSFDHMEITDCDTNFVDLTEETIDYVHANALTIDFDGHILMSSRHLNEITKIDIHTGDIIWRWGGIMNQFTFQGGTPFSGQHTIRYNESDNTYTMFDNGNHHDPERSRGLEYHLDQGNLIATLTNIYENDPAIFSGRMGGMQRLDAGGTVVGWGSNTGRFVFTEYDNSGEEVLKVNCIDASLVSYRAFKYDWKTSLFDFLEDSLDFGEVHIGDSGFLEISVKNNQSEALPINGFNIKDTMAFSLQTTLPVIIEPEGTQKFNIKFKPLEEKNYISVLSLFHSTDTSRIAQQIKLSGGGIMVNTPEFQHFSSQQLEIYPNPMSSNTTIKLSNNEAIQHIKVIDVSGRIILEQEINGQEAISLSKDSFKQGIYYLVVKGSGAIYTGKLLVTK